MNTILKRVISLMLCLVLVAGYLPVGALAEEITPVQEPSADTTVVVEEEAAAEAEESEDTSLTEDDENTSTVGDAEKEVSEESSADEETETPSEGDEVVTEEDVTEGETVTEEPAEDESVTEEPATEESATEETVTEETASTVEEVSLVAPLLDANETTYVLAGSDFQASSHDAGATIVSGLLDKIKVDYPTMNGFLFAGDYDVNYSDSANGKAKLQETVQAVYGTGMDEIYVQGNHDGDNLVGSTLTASGANDAENYGVFVINEKDYMWYNNDEATIKKTAENLKSYLNAKRNAGYTKPIFVISHLPLHYCMRTREGGNDGMHANYIFDVLNEAGNAGLNIIFMFGHNHSHGWDDYLGGAAIFLTKGDKINIAQNSTTVFKEETLAFTYMNAGYVGYYGTSYTSDVDKTLTMTTFAITDTDVTISRYDSNGTHDLKSAGVYNVEHPDSAYYSTDTTTVGTPYILTLNTEITPAGEEVEVPDSGSTDSTERTYTRVTSTSDLVSGGQYLLIYDGSHFMLPEVVEKSDGSVRKGFNIESTSVCGPDTITGDYSAKEWTLTSSGSGWLLGNGTQYAKLTNTSNYKVTATLENSGDVFTIGGSENAFTFSDGDYVLNYNDRGLINGYASNAATFYIYRMTNEGSSSDNDNITGYSVEPAVGTVTKGAAQTAWTQAEITVHLESGDDYTVPITVSMLTKADGSSVSTGEEGTFENLKLTYNDVVITESFTLNVVAKTGNNYPEYPNEGAVKVNKTGTGIDFQSSGIAQVEISASGVPMKKGADVIVMLDLSSSMTNTVDGKTRLSVLEASLQSLMTQLKANGDDGEPMDIRIAVADFNRYYTDTSSPYYINSADHLKGGSIRTNNSGTNQVYTGSNKLNAAAFVSVHDLAVNEFTGLSTKSGTNYDYAFDAVYQLGEAITTQNATDGTERDLFVIFMSDGAPFQYNYFSSQSGESNKITDARYWNNWLQGTMEDSMFDSNARNDYYNEDGKHWMAEAIKGDPDLDYRVIRKNNAADTDGDNWVNVNGLGAKMYSIGFCLAVDKEITVATMDTVIRNIASEEQYYFRADTAADLNNAFKAIGSDIAYAAYNARFVDQMGDDYNLQMAVSNYSVVDGNTTTGKTIEPKIEIISYDIYTRQDFLNGSIAEDKIGDRKGTYTVLETVTFNGDGTEAYSDKKSGNILINGVICAQSFWYNTNATAVAVEGVSIPTGTKADGTTTGSTNLLPAETFYWKMGTVQTSELAMRYYVYLDGSMEGTREGGSYPTNEYATLYYDNYLGNPCYKDTVSPVMPWKEANVSYAFYLVDENGKIIVNQTTGQTGSFANKIAVTNPVVYDTVLLNNGQNVESLDVASLGVLPEGYTLYDAVYDENGNATTGAVYTVNINSNTTGSWNITSVKDVPTTYVMHYDPNEASAYSNEKSVSEVGLDYTHTVVWFAVLWKVQALPDSVVIDYGLPVDISVLANDMFGENGKLAGVGAYSDTLNLDGHDTALASGFGNIFDTDQGAKYGTATADASTGKVRYTLDTMEMNGYEKFAYAVNYTGNENAGYYYDTVTVIPATTIYYEDNFVDFAGYIRESAEAEYTVNHNAWIQVGETEDETQSEDRPGKFSLSHIDANNVYGYDPAYDSMSQYSMGSAMKAHVGANSYATATFDFHGTGFDIVGLTSNQTGVLTLKVYNYGEDTTTMTKAVDTYYGYTKDAEGNWITTTETNNALYQVPVLQVENLTYGHYTAVLTADYFSAMDETVAEGYDLYLDAIRIYDPANDGATDNDTVIEDAYVDDNEGWPQYIELRNELIDAASVKISVDSYGFVTVTEPENGVVNGAVFVDGVGETASVSDYVSYGPNNELYLNPKQHVIFKLNLGNAKIADVQIAMKAENGVPATYKLCNTAVNTDGTGTEFNAKADTLNSATEQYYSIKVQSGNTITLSNTGDSGILSVTNIKITYTENPANIPDPTVELENEELAAAVMSLRKTAVQEPDIEPTEPDETEPVETEPVETEPAETEPDVTEPEPTVPETTKPEQDDQQNQNGAFGKDAIEKITKIIKNIFKGWFR